MKCPLTCHGGPAVPILSSLSLHAYAYWLTNHNYSRVTVISTVHVSDALTEYIPLMFRFYSLEPDPNNPEFNLLKLKLQCFSISLRAQQMVQV